MYREGWALHCETPDLLLNFQVFSCSQDTHATREQRLVLGDNLDFSAESLFPTVLQHLVMFDCSELLSG